METTLCQNETINEPSKMPAKSGGNVKNDSTTTTENKNVKGSKPIIKVGRVYLITNLINNKKYVGITIRTIENRFKQHIWESNGRCLYVINKAIRKYGEENFKVELIEELYNITEKELFLKESFYINKYNTFIENGCGYNLVKYDNNRLIVSEETKKRMSKKSTGKNNSLYGKHHSLKSKNKMSVSLKGKFAGDKNYFYGKQFFGKNNSFYGKTHTEEMKKLLSSIHRGKCLTEKTKQKMSLAHIGKSVGNKSGHFDYTVRKFRNIHTNEEFSGFQYDFIRKYNLNKSSVNALLKRRLKTLKGWILVSEA